MIIYSPIINSTLSILPPWGDDDDEPGGKWERGWCSFMLQKAHPHLEFCSISHKTSLLALSILTFSWLLLLRGGWLKVAKKR